LISAIAACVDQRLQRQARKFLLGLSTDELQYIADFLGACALESVVRSTATRRELAEHVAHFSHLRASARAAGPRDRDHKMILLWEYLRRCEPAQQSHAAGEA